MHLPGVACEPDVRAACERAGARVTELHAGARVVITADGVGERGVVRALKDEADAVAERAERVIVLRLAGDAPLAPTMDAYLDVPMRPGRDVWLDDL